MQRLLVILLLLTLGSCGQDDAPCSLPDQTCPEVPPCPVPDLSETAPAPEIEETVETEMTAPVDDQISCRPCNGEQDCLADPSLDGRCVKYGADQGAFCALSCTPEAPCPEGYSCQMAVTWLGQVRPLCLPVSGKCQCPELAVRMQMSTACSIKNEFGTCTGTRTCTPDGLTDCDAVAPAQETCDGIDNNCDGQTDFKVCDDNNLCTQDTCTPGQGCSHQPLDGAKCLDFDECTQDETCVAGQCLGSPVQCDDGNECTFDACLPESGCHQFPQPDKTPCGTDGQDECIAGVCTPETQ